jgi:hypothetical protein
MEAMCSNNKLNNIYIISGYMKHMLKTHYLR